MQPSNPTSTLRCSNITRFEPDSWDTVEQAFASAETVSMRQAWRDAPEPGFRPATLRTAYGNGQLLVYAILQDDDIFNPVTTFNEPAFPHGDVFEIFLRPASQDAYYEFHISPQNHHFQLRIPSSDAFASGGAGGAIPSEWLLHEWEIHSRVSVEPDRNRWRVLAEVPIDRILEGHPFQPEVAWWYSFSRYDYTRGHASPVLSSTSAHTKVNFHRQQEWGCLQFVDL